MVGTSLLTFNEAPTDLSVYEDSWCGNTIEEREKRLLDEIRQWHINDLGLANEDDIQKLEQRNPYALLPSKNMRFIREISFPVINAVTVDDIREIIPKIRDKFVIDCFQIAIDRENMVAHMVFDWFDRSHGNCVYLYPNKRVRFSVFLVRELDLPRPEGYEMWLRHFLLEEYKEDKEVFRIMSEHLKHLRLGRRGYNLVRDALQYVELVCRNLTK